MGGQIEVSSQIDEGSTFSFRLPFAYGEVDSPRKLLTTIDSYEKLSGMQVLLVEDNPVNQKVALGLLKAKNILVDIANDGQECLDILAKPDAPPYQLILMDIEMPNMDGLTATAEIRKSKKWQSIPVIAMTAHAIKGDRDRFLNAGMTAYVSKPISPSAFYHTLIGTVD
jgi:CheY-like chemotaxis protein